MPLRYGVFLWCGQQKLCQRYFGPLVVGNPFQIIITSFTIKTLRLTAEAN